MNREIIALKAGEGDPARYDAAIREIRTRYGYPAPVLDAGPAPAADPSATEAQAGPQGGSLEKSAAVYTDTWLNVKVANIRFGMAGLKTFSVPAGERFEVTTSTYAGAPSDPVLVAFYRNGGTSASSGFLTRIIAFNDDLSSSDVNARIQWANTLGVSREVTVVTFARSTSSTGSTIVTYKFSDRPKIIDPQVAVWVAPTYNFPSRPVSCLSPKAGRLRLVYQSGGGWKSTVVAVNLATMRGGLIREKDGAGAQTISLEDPLGSGFGTGFILAFIPGLVDPLQVDNEYVAYQDNLYPCLVPGL